MASSGTTSSRLASARTPIASVSTGCTLGNAFYMCAVHIHDCVVRKHDKIVAGNSEEHSLYAVGAASVHLNLTADQMSRLLNLILLPLNRVRRVLETHIHGSFSFHNGEMDFVDRFAND